MSNPFLDNDSNNYGTKQSQLEATRNKTIESQRNALRSLAISEQVGTNTASELMDQGEKLDRTNQRLDEISEKQKISDKHINNLNSGFLGGLVGLFKKKETPAPSENKKDKVYNTYRDPQLSQVVQSYKPKSDYDTNTTSASSGRYEDEFNKNIDDMSHCVGRINNLAKGLGTELDRQNELLEVMAPKTDKINAQMATQNKQLNVLLFGKPK